jgi:hypothetical protein
MAYIGKRTIAWARFIGDVDRLGPALPNDVDWIAVSSAAGRGCDRHFSETEDCFVLRLGSVIARYYATVNV